MGKEEEEEKGLYIEEGGGGGRGCRLEPNWTTTLGNNVLTFSALDVVLTKRIEPQRFDVLDAGPKRVDVLGARLIRKQPTNVFSATLYLTCRTVMFVVVSLRKGGNRLVVNCDVRCHRQN